MAVVPGSTLGPYTILEQIGRGGMATVYSALQPSLGRRVAIKVLPDFFAQEPGFRERFQQEAVAVAQFRHPNILAVYEYAEADGVHYIVTELAAGGRLSERLGQPMPVDEAVRLLRPIASAVDYAHEHGVLHRDIKPSNLLFTEDGTIVLADFGLARIQSATDRLTRTGDIIGTPEYMSPEQASGAEDGPSSDRYALAVVAYEMLTGRLPYSGATPLAVLLAHLNQPLPPPRELNPALSEPVEKVLQKALAKKPEDRYETAVAFAEDLAKAAAMPATDSKAAAAARPAQAKPITAVAAPTDGVKSGSAPDAAPASATAKSAPPSVEASAPDAAHSLPIATTGGEPKKRRKLIIVAGIAAVVLVLSAAATVVYFNDEGGGAAATAAEKADASAAAVATPGPLYMDDFSDPAKSAFAISLGQGTNTNGVGFDREITEGAFMVKLTKGQPGRYLLSPEPDRVKAGSGLLIANRGWFAVEADIHALGKTQLVGYGFALNGDNVGGVRVQILPASGTYLVTEVQSQSVTVLAREPSPAIRTGEGTNHLRIEVRGTAIKVLVNGTLVSSLTEASLTQRPASALLLTSIQGTAALQPSDDARAYFDNFAVTTLAQPKP